MPEDSLVAPAEPDWLTTLRETVAVAQDIHPNPALSYSAAFLGRFLRRHDQLREHADRMADALECLVSNATNHRPIPFSPFCGTCSRLWPCPPVDAAATLRQYRGATSKEEAR